eukprot:TRINITY_DN14396_c0_g1_i1.p1 TRINITY_DN14396_c0_g1~~TRINITY_DN14396_c0_g1_i1.p1  ORF type:complete len:186 (+),score=29.27 TRINITY_DN14396_c0_g1_i1:165-722(+)
MAASRHTTRFMRSPPGVLRRVFGVLGAPTERCRFVDVGCGDGAVLAAALQHGYRSVIGLELDAVLCSQAREKVVSWRRRHGDASAVTEATVLQADFGASEESLAAEALAAVKRASLVYFFLDSGGVEQLQPLLSRVCRPGTRVVSIDFPLVATDELPQTGRFMVGDMEVLMYTKMGESYTKMGES